MKRVLLVNLAVTFVLIVWGSVVRNAGAGLGCPDWPLCHGQIIPPPQVDAWIEWIHRFLASLVGFITLGTFLFISFKKNLRKKYFLLSLLSFILLIIQALLGARAVTTELQPHYVVIHLAVALIFFSILLIMYLKEKNTFYELSKNIGQQKNIVLLILIFVGFLFYLQSLMGGWVAATGGGEHCPEFPDCLFQGFLKFHVWGAFFVFVATYGLVFFARTLKITGSLKGSISGLFMGTAVQIIIGVGNVYFGLPLWAGVLHTALATGLFAMLVAMTYRLIKS